MKFRPVAETLDTLAKAQRLNHKLDAAIVTMNKAVALKPIDPTYKVTLGSMLVEARRLEEARRTLSRVDAKSLMDNEYIELYNTTMVKLEKLSKAATTKSTSRPVVSVTK